MPLNARPRAFAPTRALAATVCLVAAALLAIVAIARPAWSQPASPAVPTAPKAPAAPVKPTTPAPTTPAVEPAEGVIRFGLEKPLARTPGTIRLATYNIENLFDATVDGKPASANQPLKPREHREAVAKAIRAVDADVVALQEIASLETLTRFRDEYLSGMGYDHIVSPDAGDERGIENAVLSRFPLKDPTLWIHKELGGQQPARLGRDNNPDAGKPFVFKRSPLRVTVEVPASKVADLLGTKPASDAKPYLLTLFVVHHKSGRASADNEWRTREAEGTIALVKEHERTLNGANIIVLGDFNAEPTDAPVQAYAKAGLVSAFKDGSKEDPRVVTHASQRIIDHILMNTNAQGEFVPESRFVLGTPNRPLNVDWRTTPSPKGYASDHAPVVVDLRPRD
jgi:endonuclease/exonuclease/phosphatase family metal-dependent hydrolase